MVTALGIKAKVFLFVDPVLNEQDFVLRWGVHSADK